MLVHGVVAARGEVLGLQTTRHVRAQDTASSLQVTERGMLLMMFLSGTL